MLFRLLCVNEDESKLQSAPRTKNDQTGERRTLPELNQEQKPYIPVVVKICTG